jgi:MFS family permease
MTRKQPPEEKTEANLKSLYTRSVVNSLSSGMVNPFTGAYAVKLGASSSLMGWFQSSSNISNNVMQVIWGRLSDRLRKRIPFIILGGLTVSALWIPMIFVTNATQLIILLAVQALLGSMATPALTAIIGDLVPTSRFGRANASINLWASIGGLIATLAAGILMMTIGGTLQGMFFIPLTAATVLGIVSSLPVLGIKEKKNSEKPNLKQHFASDIFSVLKYTRKNPDFLKYCYVVATFEFFMSISWPLFSITQVTVLNVSMLQLALLSVVQSVVMIAFQDWAGKRADTTGRKPLLVFFRFSLITVPIAYALSPDINTLIAIGAFWGLASALGQAAVTAYLLDVTPEEHRGSFAAIFNLIIGVTTFIGSLIGGYLSDYLTGVFGLVLALQIVYLISTIGRTIGAALHLTLKETLKR